MLERLSTETVQLTKGCQYFSRGQHAGGEPRVDNPAVRIHDIVLNLPLGHIRL